MKAATTVNKQTGHVNGYIDRRTKADEKNIFNMLMKVRHIKDQTVIIEKHLVKI